MKILYTVPKPNDTRNVLLHAPEALKMLLTVGGERLVQVDPRLSGPMLECLLMGRDPVEVSPGDEAEE